MPTLTKADAYSQAAARARSGATVQDILRDADAIYNYVNGTTGASCASAAPKPATVVKKIPRTYYKVEYKDKVGNKTHFGKKEYSTYNGAYKNATRTTNTRKAPTRQGRFVRVVKFTESV